MNDKLFAWGNTTKIGAFDHTWVTTYSKGQGVPDKSLGDYWYCWGDPHFKATLFGESESGGDFARIVAKPNDPQESVNIKYGFDGVCHQMANRLLMFTKSKATGKPIVVSDASGYQLSKAMYGVYGGSKKTKGARERLEAWESKVDSYLKAKGVKNE
ncbi:hypothetical protein [Vibrio hepatarius]|uniref:hypothetical protein n=1 Tax=Vibrio hepatarius TaxID=171383 RepID=UPI00142D99DA|nr:hypothetical protein [Vibrio hepatarius]NIY85452.1 hypothetical protein [Vibrio hepatarius]